jgi:hypothetical protein
MGKLVAPIRGAHSESNGRHSDALSDRLTSKPDRYYVEVAQTNDGELSRLYVDQRCVRSSDG